MGVVNRITSKQEGKSMRNVLFSAAVFLLCTSVAFGATFSPTPLRLSAPEHIQYNFGGENLLVPVTVSGAPANITFLVFTKDKAGSISKVKNGFLGWHYVNKIDTCVYFSGPQQLAKGSGAITWNGKDQDGKIVSPGDYSYYLWGFDHVSPRVKAFKWTTPGPNVMIFEKDKDGKTLANPIVTSNNAKWTLGSDPEDNTLREVTTLPGITGWVIRGRVAYQSNDFNTLYAPVHHLDSKTGGVWKIGWVPGGKAVRDEKFEVKWNQITQYHMTAQTNGEYVFVTENNYKEKEVRAPIHIVDPVEGEYVGYLDLGDWWGSLDDFNAGAQMNGGPGISYMREGKMYLGMHGSCLKQVIDPMAFFGDPEEAVIWTNDNGDYVDDHNFEPNAKMPWVCFDFNVGPYNYTFQSDANHFAFCPTFDMGAVSFSLHAPDGTGIGYFAFAGETAAQKSGVLVCDNGSTFDGFYTSINHADSAAVLPATWFIGQDSIKGVISKEVGVKEFAPAAFTVAQNTPNPFNPTTTISFTLANAGMTTVEVFNAAGQKVDTILNANLSSGSHSVTWDATRHSAGVYFYTVKNGSFSRTMKMTLLK
jgi:flagellar hook assembly protein FlgD